MGMYFGLCTLSDENIRKVLLDPRLIWKVLSSLRSRHAGFFQTMWDRERQSAAPPVDLELAEGEVAHLGLDKAWHGIHYLLTGTAEEGDEPLNFLVGGGADIGKVDVGCGPARVFTSKQIQNVRSALCPIDENSLRHRFKPSEMMELGIYPAIWDRDPAEDDTFQYCARHFGALKHFIEQAARREFGLVTYIA